MRATQSKFIIQSRGRSQPSKLPVWKPLPYMRRAVKWLVDRKSAALFLDPGLRKTSITLSAFQELLTAGIARGMLVVAPLRPATMVWPAECAGWLQFSTMKLVVLHGKHKEQLAQEKADIYVVNYEGLEWLISKGHMARLLRDKWIDIIVFDELSKMKSSSQKLRRRVLLKPWLPRFARRWGLTGSPAPNGLMNLFGQMLTIDLGQALGMYVTHFRNRYFMPVGMYDWVPTPHAEEEIYARIAPIALRMSAEDYITVPKQIEVDIKVQLPADARKVYDAMEDEMLAVLDKEVIHAAAAGAAYDKCRQIASGAVYRDKFDPVTGEARSGSAWLQLHDAKLDALEEIVDEMQGVQLLVAYWYGHELERLKNRFGADLPYIGAGVSIKRAQWLEDAWNVGELPVLYGHPASMGHGLNLQKSNAHHICWLAPTPDLELYDQFNRRLRRSGNKSSFTMVRRIVCASTVESWGILPSLKAKDRDQEKLFTALKKYARSRR